MLNTQNLQEVKFMEKDEIREIAPSVFTTKPSDEVSKKYTHIPTEKVINDMESLGWGVADVKEVKARKSRTKGFQKHLVIFRNMILLLRGMMEIMFIHRFYLPIPMMVKIHSNLQQVYLE